MAAFSCRLASARYPSILLCLLSLAELVTLGACKEVTTILCAFAESLHVLQVHRECRDSTGEGLLVKIGTRLKGLHKHLVLQDDRQIICIVSSDQSDLLSDLLHFIKHITY